jgi:hypothetical protein
MRQLQADTTQTQQMLELKSEEKADTINKIRIHAFATKRGFYSPHNEFYLNAQPLVTVLLVFYCLVNDCCNI